jgi:hypothetical protein
MDCEAIRSLVADDLAGVLPPSDSARLEAHLRGCDACAAEVAAARDTWQRLGVLTGPAPDSGAMRARFQAALEEQVHATQVSTQAAPRRALPYWLQAAAAVVLVAGGAAAGRLTAPEPAPDPEIATVSAELRELREMFTLSLLQQQSASARLKGITWTSQIDQPGTDIAAALLDTLRHDPNMAVRLATIDALKRFAAEEGVRRGALEALPRETSPFVQLALIDFVVEVHGSGAADTLRALSIDPATDAAVRAKAAESIERLQRNRV